MRRTLTSYQVDRLNLCLLSGSVPASTPSFAACLPTVAYDPTFALRAALEMHDAAHIAQLQQFLADLLSFYVVLVDSLQHLFEWVSRSIPR